MRSLVKSIIITLYNEGTMTQRERDTVRRQSM